MHPHRRQHGEVETLAACIHAGKLGQRIADPFDARRGMKPPRVRS
jgi:hypothetical protein